MARGAQGTPPDDRRRLQCRLVHRLRAVLGATVALALALGPAHGAAPGDPAAAPGAPQAAAAAPPQTPAPSQARDPGAPEDVGVAFRRLARRLDELSADPTPPDRHLQRPSASSGNPAATNKSPGVGLLGRLVDLDALGVRLGGIWMGEVSGALVGGLHQGSWRGQNLLVADATLDLERLVGWPGALAGGELLTHGGTAASSLTGDVQGFDGLDGGPPLDRTELYELWLRQSLFDGRVVLRLGKQVPSYDFAVVADVTPLVFTPVFAMPTMLGRAPGYPDSATGISVFAYPTTDLYAGFGFYDGRLGAKGIPTGNRSPDLDGDYFFIGEAGATWSLGGSRLPGGFGAGGWGQTGRLERFDGSVQDGTSGFFALVKQHLWAEPDAAGQGLVAYLVLGLADPEVQLAEAYVGGGLSWTGPIPGRGADSIATGFAWSDLSGEAERHAMPTPPLPPGRVRPSELILQTTYQLVVTRNLFLQPTLSWIPHPGQSSGIPNALALTLRMGILF